MFLSWTPGVVIWLVVWNKPCGPNFPVVWLCLADWVGSFTTFMPWLAKPWILLGLQTMRGLFWCVGSLSLTWVMTTTLWRWWRVVLGFTMRDWLKQGMLHTRFSKDVSPSTSRSQRFVLVPKRWACIPPLLRGPTRPPWWTCGQGLEGYPRLPSQLVGGLQWWLIIARKWLGFTCKPVMLQCFVVTSVTLQCVVTSGSSPMVPAYGRPVSALNRTQDLAMVGAVMKQELVVFLRPSQLHFTRNSGSWCLHVCHQPALMLMWHPIICSALETQDLSTLGLGTMGVQFHKYSREDLDSSSEPSGLSRCSQSPCNSMLDFPWAPVDHLLTYFCFTLVFCFYHGLLLLMPTVGSAAFTMVRFRATRKPWLLSTQDGQSHL